MESIGLCRVPKGLRWEIIVVNNNCTDDTDAVVNRYKQRLPIVLVNEPIQGLSRAKNAGLAAVRGELIIFTDDDVKFSSNWLETYWNAYSRMPTGFFWGGAVESEFEDSKVPPQLLSLVKDYSIVGFELPWAGVPDNPNARFISANWACTKKELETLGGFNTSLGLNAVQGKVLLGEETDMMNRLLSKGNKMWYLPEARIQHYVPKTKTTLRHISQRIKALGETYFRGLIYNPSKPKLCGVPLLVYRLIVMAQLKWVLSQLSGRPDYSQFVGYWHYCGVWKGFFKESKT